MSKRRKLDEYLANAGFQGIDLNTMPFELLVNGLMNLSAKELLSLHGMSKDLRNKRLRQATESAMKRDLQTYLDVIEPKFSDINYRHLFIAVLAYENTIEIADEMIRKKISFKLNDTLLFRIEYHPFQNMWDSPVVTIRGDKQSVWDFGGYIIKKGYIKKGLTSFQHDSYTDKGSILIRRYALDDDISNYLFRVLIIYAALEQNPNIYIDNTESLFPDISHDARIRCSICNVQAKLECKECKTYFCSEECHYK